MVYSTVEICQVLIIGPDWLRWNAGSIGFSSSWAITLSMLFGTPIIKGLIGSFLVQVSWEIGQYPAGHFDTYDMLIGTIGTVIVLLTAYNYRTKSFPIFTFSEYVRFIKSN